MLFNPLHRALRNGILLSITVGAIVYLQGDPWTTALSSFVLTFAILTPTFWLAYKWANHIVVKQRKKRDTDHTNQD